MSQILWDENGSRLFETGLDRGVLYPAAGGGVPWNGLTSIQENSADASTPYYIDGVKYLDAPTIDDYAATVTGFTYPDAMENALGLLEVGGGFYADNQQSNLFGFSYRTLIGNDLQGLEKGYEIHVVYNVSASLGDRSYETNSSDISMMDLSWEITTMPENLPGYRPSAHIIIDTTRMNRFLVADLEAVLYGDDVNDARLPSLVELAEYTAGWELFTVVDNGDGTWTIDGPAELITWVTPTQFKIEQIEATYLDPDTYVINTNAS